MKTSSVTNSPTATEKLNGDISEIGEPISRTIGDLTAKVARVFGNCFGKEAEQVPVVVGAGGVGGTVGGTIGAILGGCVGTTAASAFTAAAGGATATAGAAVIAPFIVPTFAILGGVTGALYVGEKSIKWAWHFLE